MGLGTFPRRPQSGRALLTVSDHASTCQPATRRQMAPSGQRSRNHCVVIKAEGLLKMGLPSPYRILAYPTEVLLNLLGRQGGTVDSFWVSPAASGLKRGEKSLLEQRGTA